ncbi:hypothetical protein QOT17_015056 [Balamuthia mandrillaris]
MSSITNDVNQKTFNCASQLCLRAYLMFYFGGGVQGQGCSPQKCDRVIPLNVGAALDLRNDEFEEGGPVQPGQTVCFESGERESVRLYNFKGTAEEPITFTNCEGGRAIVRAKDSSWGVQLFDCEYVHFTGTGDESITYGWDIASENAQCFGFLGLSSYLELDHVEVSSCKYAGLAIKQDPVCDTDIYDYGNFVMRGIHVHHNFIHDAGTEGMYIGSSFCYDHPISSCATTSKPAHRLRNIKIHNNLVENSGWDGIQVGCSDEDVDLFANVIDGYGLANEQYQTSGFQIGGGTTGRVFSNIIRNGHNGHAILHHGIGDNLIFNNVIENVRGSGIVSSDLGAAIAGKYIYAFHNTLVNVQKPNGASWAAAIKITSPNTMNKIFNNLIAGHPSFDDTDFQCTGGSGNTEVSNNECLLTVEEVGFTNAAQRDYTLTADSPAVNTGISISDYEVGFDFNIHLRPAAGTAPDAGAFEYGSTEAPSDTPGLPSDDYEFEPPSNDGDGEDDSSALLRPSLLIF